MANNNNKKKGHEKITMRFFLNNLNGNVGNRDKHVNGKVSPSFLNQKEKNFSKKTNKQNTWGDNQVFEMITIIREFNS